MSTVRKIRRMIQEFPGLKEAIDLTIENAFKIKRVTFISVKRVDSSLLHRVLVDEHFTGGDTTYRRVQNLWVLKGGDAICVDIRKAVTTESATAYSGPRIEEAGEQIGMRLLRVEAEYLVLTDEVFNNRGEGVFELSVTVYKPSKGSSIELDVAWEFAFPAQTEEEIAAEMELGYKAIQDRQDAEMAAAYEEHYELERQAREDNDSDDEEYDEPEPTEVNIGDPISPFYIYE